MHKRENRLTLCKKRSVVRCVWNHYQCQDKTEAAANVDNAAADDVSIVKEFKLNWFC